MHPQSFRRQKQRSTNCLEISNLSQNSRSVENFLRRKVDVSKLCSLVNDEDTGYVLPRYVIVDDLDILLSRLQIHSHVHDGSYETRMQIHHHARQGFGQKVQEESTMAEVAQ
jgi:hypothetical protein